MDQFTLLVLVFDLDVAEGGVAARTPADYPVAAVDEIFFIEADEHGPDRLREAFVHGEPFPGPVTGVAEAADLLGDPASGAGLPLPDLLDEGLAPQVVAGQPFDGQFPFNDVLGRDAGVVGARHPQSGIALQAFAADQQILNGHVESMAHVQRTGDIGRRDDNRKGIAVGVVLRPEDAGGLPPVVPGRFDPLWVVRRLHRSHHS